MQCRDGEFLTFKTWKNWVHHSKSLTSKHPFTRINKKKGQEFSSTARCSKSSLHFFSLFPCFQTQNTLFNTYTKHKFSFYSYH